ncbi:Ataxin-1 Spinocerebellar ataxia type 1 protein -like protein [Collichthys lucidus]|uniref:Ataxin-1 Spinocerebellar ataxia type 1 protein-like protein n=1 Tax=Collichthys lucidus TaxID=240159 RepID=A0A4U5USX4_COLLU|nr:Ataxin-1 Spinocerebellar ataxia type 1 protein -like protein [Collichthys lucidus]
MRGRSERGEAQVLLPGEMIPSPHPCTTTPGGLEGKTPFPADSREMWSYINSGRRDNSSSLFSPPYLFSQHSLYPHDPSLVEARHRYLGKRPNGLDGPGSRTASTSRPLLTGEYGNDGSRTRLDVSPHSSHTNGGRRQQEDLTSRIHSGGPFLSDSQAQEGPEPHSSLQDRHPHGLVKTSSNLLSTSPHPLGLVPRAGRGGLLDPLGPTPAEAQIYYSLGSVCHPSPQAQAYPLYSPSGTPQFNLHREPGPRQHNLRNSPHSPLGLPNSHDRSQRDRERDRDRDQERDREKVPQRDRERSKDKDKEKHLQHDKDQERDSERERRRDRERDRGIELSPSHLHTSPPALHSHSSPPVLLPHFTKGSLIELASGRLKRVEDLRTEDFLRSADTSPEFHLSTCTVLQISPSSAQGFSHLQVHLTDLNTQELLKVLVEYPFFVQDRGWSSCSPQKTSQLYGLSCRQLMEGDVCLALTPTPTQTHRTHTRAGSRTHRTHVSSRVAGESSSSNREEMPPPPPPPPLPHHHPPPTPPAPPRTLATEPPVQEQPRPRKRRWSAPDTLPSTGTDASSLLDLPHGSKLMKWQ